METTAFSFGRLEHKVVWRQAPSGAWYGFADDESPAAGPSGPAWGDGPPAADLARAMAAGKAAVAAGYGPQLRHDGLVPCGHCVPCDHGQPDRCHRPVERVEARLTAQQAEGDRVDQADRASAELTRVIFAEEWRRGVAL